MVDIDIPSITPSTYLAVAAAQTRPDLPNSICTPQPLRYSLPLHLRLLTYQAQSPITDKRTMRRSRGVVGPDASFDMWHSTAQHSIASIPAFPPSVPFPSLPLPSFVSYCLLLLLLLLLRRKTEEGTGEWKTNGTERNGL